MRLNRDEWGLSVRMDKQYRTIPHIYWDVERQRYCCLWSKDVYYAPPDDKAESYVHKLNLTKQAHPVK